MSWTCMQSFSFITLMISEQKIFSKIYPLCCHGKQSNSAILTKFIWIVEDYSRNISVKKNLNICPETAKNANFHFSHYKSMETISCHSPYPIGKKKQYYLFPLPIDAMCEIWQELASWLQRRCRLKMLTTDNDRRTTDACIYYKLTYEPSAQVSWQSCSLIGKAHHVCPCKYWYWAATADTGQFQI